MLDFSFHVDPLTDAPRDIAAGETARRRVILPPLSTGRYRIEFDCVASRVSWFAQIGIETGDGRAGGHSTVGILISWARGARSYTPDGG